MKAAALVILIVAMTTAVAVAESRPRPMTKAHGTVRMVATAYCLDGPTKSGAWTVEGIVAADPSILPVGSVVRIDIPDRKHSQAYAVLDTGAAIKGPRVDIFMRSCERAKNFGRRPVLVRLLKRA
jgi:3D (Asp-Asp-Asp) domain-containing protein